MSTEPTELEAPIRTITTIGTVRTKVFSSTILAAASWINIFKVPAEFFRPQLLSIIQSLSDLFFGMLRDKKVSQKVAPADFLYEG